MRGGGANKITKDNLIIYKGGGYTKKVGVKMEENRTKHNVLFQLFLHEYLTSEEDISLTFHTINMITKCNALSHNLALCQD